VENPEKKLISQEQWEQVDKLLLERVSLRGICRVVGISLTWLLQYVKKKAVMQQEQFKKSVEKKEKGSMVVQCGRNKRKRGICWSG